MNPGNKRNVSFAQDWLLELLNYLRSLDDNIKSILPGNKHPEWCEESLGVTLAVCDAFSIVYQPLVLSVAWDSRFMQ